MAALRCVMAGAHLRGKAVRLSPTTSAPLTTCFFFLSPLKPGPGADSGQGRAGAGWREAQLVVGAAAAALVAGAGASNDGLRLWTWVGGGRQWVAYPAPRGGTGRHASCGSRIVLFQPRAHLRASSRTSRCRLGVFPTS